jgi:hypothetical protein
MYPLDPPFELGATLSGKDSDGNLINREKLGMMWDFYTVPVNAQRGKKAFPGGGKRIRCVALRNVSGVTLLGKRLGLVSKTSGYAGVQEVDGYSATLAVKPVVAIDPFLPATGVADDDIFWGIIGGPVELLTPTSGGDFGSNIAIGDALIAAVGAGITNVAAGRVAKIQLSGATDATGAVAQIPGIFGRALQAAATTATDTAILVEMHCPWFG